MVEKLKEKLCVYPRIRTFYGVSSEIIMDLIKEESSVLYPLGDPIKDQLCEYVALQLLNDLSPKKGMDLSTALTTFLCTNVCYKCKCIYHKVTSQNTMLSETCP
jgi:hypothetical protein